MIARSLTLLYAHSTGDGDGVENDYRLFGIVKDAMENTWKRRPLKIEIKNGLIFNSQSSTSGEMASVEFELGIFIKTRLRDRKLVYAYHTECNQSVTTGTTNNKSLYTDFIRKSQFYAEMKRITIATAKGCPE